MIDKSKYKSRIIDKTIERYLKVSGAICIEGPKWCGKTWTSAFHSKSEFLVGNPEKNFTNKRLAEMDPVLILEGDTPRMIDEWQYVPAIWDATREEVDRRQRKGQIILTGSSTPERKGIMHTGAGRIVSLRMNTMSLFETGDSSGKISLKDLCDGIINPQMTEETSLEKLAYFIIRGGWPENASVEPSEAHLMPRSYMDNLINEGIERLDDATYDKRKVSSFLSSLARNESTTVSDSSLLNDIGVDNGNSPSSRITVSKYLHVLERLFIIDNQKPFSPNIRSSLRVKQAEKRHFSDPAMACALLNLTPEKLLSDFNTFGFMFEALVEHDLKIYAQSFGGKLFHYQDYRDNEIDAVIELEDGDWCAFEIKLGANKVDEGARRLNAVCEDIVKHGGKAPKVKCIICGFANAAYKRDDDVFVVPLTALKD